MPPIVAPAGLLFLCLAHPQSSEYGRWTAFEAGATASYRHSGEIAGKGVDLTRSYALVEASPERVVLEEKVTTSGETHSSRLIRSIFTPSEPSATAGATHITTVTGP